MGPRLGTGVDRVLFGFLLCPAAGDYGSKMFWYLGASFCSDLFSLLDVLASVIGLGKRELGALSCAVFLKQPRGRRCNSLF